ncbi:hypothetical protein LCL61_23145 [Amycolatopsis coloradensis]|uniref:Uncharacterized protein n=1 Tax=Amycolatopsis coloradensis TaxID=76021 RepID=A0ACD5BGQ1_9PSEU
MDEEEAVRGARPTDPAEGADHRNPNSPEEQRKSVEQSGEAREGSAGERPDGRDS